jgi:hypothetical protein
VEGIFEWNQRLAQNSINIDKFVPIVFFIEVDDKIVFALNRISFSHIIDCESISKFNQY